MSDRSRLTLVFRAAEDGEEIELDSVLPVLYDELRRLAGGYLRQQQAGHTLQPTALVHEAYIKLLDQTQLQWSNAAHFRAIASAAMRQVLVDHARKRGAQKRGGDRVRVTLDSAAAMTKDTTIDMLALDEALRSLAAHDERKARVVELIFFGGMTHAETARVIGMSQKTIEADWYMARAWLSDRLDTKAD